MIRLFNEDESIFDFCSVPGTHMGDVEHSVFGRKDNRKLILDSEALPDYGFGMLQSCASKQLARP